MSNKHQNYITYLTKTSKHYYTYSTINLNHITKITLNQKNNLYIYKNHTKNIQIITPKKNHIKTIISQKKITYPHTITYNKKKNHLLITQKNKNIIKIFQFK